MQCHAADVASAPPSRRTRSFLPVKPSDLYSERKEAHIVSGVQSTKVEAAQPPSASAGHTRCAHARRRRFFRGVF